SARLLGTSAAAPQISRAIALAWLNAPAGRRAPAPAPGGDVSAVVIEDLQPIDAPAAPGDGTSTAKVEESPEQALRRARLGDS
ncbi:hypothetical protein, partial [Escherichia coli]|uniref:hypothetical protein n=1 Tax=Escherichia coli TaxID=562 RepID=UPI001953D8B7